MPVSEEHFKTQCFSVSGTDMPHITIMHYYTFLSDVGAKVKMWYLLLFHIKFCFYFIFFFFTSNLNIMVNMSIHLFDLKIFFLHLRNLNYSITIFSKVIFHLALLNFLFLIRYNWSHWNKFVFLEAQVQLFLKVNILI